MTIQQLKAVLVENV